MAIIGPEIVRRELRPRELLRWVGYPIAKRRAVQISWRTFLFGIPFLAFSFFWESKVFDSGAPIVFMLFGAIFVGIGTWLLSSPLIEYWRGLRTIYVVTNQRLLILNGIFQPSVESYVPPFDIERKERLDGTLPIRFTPTPTRARMGANRI